MESIRLDQNLMEPRLTLGCIRLGQGHLEDAEALFHSVLKLRPADVNARAYLADCQLKLGDADGALASASKVIRSEPGNLNAHRAMCRALILKGDGERVRREIHRRFSFLRKPASAEAEWEQANMALLFGEMPAGWEAYEARLRVPIPNAPQIHAGVPRWQGERFEGRSLLIDFEQGLGDVLMFLRYVPRVKALGGRVILSVQRPLAALAATCAGVDEVIPFGDPLPSFDLQVPLLSLPWIFRTDLTSIPAEVPYLAVPPTLSDRAVLEEKLNVPEGRLRIALAWAGNPLHTRDAERSMPARALAPLASLPEVAWYSVHFGAHQEVPFPGITPLAPHLGSFAETAFALSTMDLVITVDTALAHLAGALGVPTFLLIHAFPDWRWLLGREDSPWYPSLRLYRQDRPDDWGPVVERLRTDLLGEG